MNNIVDIISLHRENIVAQMDKLTTMEKSARIELFIIRAFECCLEEKGTATVPTTKNIEKYLDQIALIYNSGLDLLKNINDLNYIDYANRIEEKTKTIAL